MNPFLQQTRLLGNKLVPPKRVGSQLLVNRPLFGARREDMELWLEVEGSGSKTGLSTLIVESEASLSGECEGKTPSLSPPFSSVKDNFQSCGGEMAGYHMTIDLWEETGLQQARRHSQLCRLERTAVTSPWTHGQKAGGRWWVGGASSSQNTFEHA